jgi:hypothetical protein
MSIKNERAQIISSVWQAIAQSEVDLSAIPHDQQELLVAKIADGVMVAMDHILDEEIPQPPTESQPATDVDEQVLWEGRPFLSLVEKYTITSERLKIVKGLFSRDVENFELIRVQDIDLNQGLDERVFGIGDLVIRGHDASDPQVTLRNIGDPEVVYEILRKAWLEARKRHGLQFREFM